jgi:hypothetical protein
MASVLVELSAIFYLQNGSLTKPVLLRHQVGINILDFHV